MRARRGPVPLRRSVAADVLQGAGQEQPFAQAELLDQRCGHVGVGLLGHVVAGGVAEEAEALGMQFQDALCRLIVADHEVLVMKELDHGSHGITRIRISAFLSFFRVIRVIRGRISGSNFAMRRGRLEGAVGQGHELVIAEQVRRFGLHELQHLDGQLADLDLGVPAGPHLDEVPQGPGVGGDEDLRLRGVGQHAARRLPGQLAPQRLVRLVLECSASFSTSFMYA